MRIQCIRRLVIFMYVFVFVMYLCIDCGVGQTGGIDLVFVLDESESVGARQFDLLRRFVMQISQGLDIGYRET